MRRTFSVVALAAAAATARSAIADEPPPAPASAPAVTADPREQREALATELFNAGRDLMASGQIAAGCDKLAESARLSQKVGTLGKLAECAEKMGRLVAARGHLLQAQNLARSLGDDRLPFVEQELARVDALVPKLLLSASGAAPAGLKITVDGVELGAGGLGTPIPLDPGKHAVVVSAPGKEPWTAEVALAAGGKTAPLTVPALAGAGSAKAPATATATAAPAPGRSPLAVTGILATGIGAGALAVGAFFGGRAVAKLDDSNRYGCQGSDCPSRLAMDIRREARAAGDVSTALFIAGAVAFAGGITLWLAAPSARAAERPRAGVSLSIDSVSIKGSF